MRDAVAFFASLAGVWDGTGINHEGQSYQGHLTIDAPFNESAVTVLFTATGADGSVYHREMLTIGVDQARDLVAISASNNMPGLVRFAASRPADDTVLLSLGPPEDAAIFREKITFRLEADESLFHGFAWGMPGEPIGEKSSSNLRRVPKT